MQIPQFNIFESIQVGAWVFSTFLICLLIVHFTLGSRIRRIQKARAFQIQQFQKNLELLQASNKQLQTQVAQAKSKLYFSNVHEQWENEYHSTLNKYQNCHAKQKAPTMDLNPLVSECIAILTGDHS